jgi:hypothetical protein
MTRGDDVPIPTARDRATEAQTINSSKEFGGAARI